MAGRIAAPSISKAAATPRRSTSAEEAEPEIFATTRMFGTVIENMVYDPETLELDFDDDSLTANMRCAYPLDRSPTPRLTGLRVIPRTSSC
jgi:phosphoenolpyruvate carboxykinase (ATP)